MNEEEQDLIELSVLHGIAGDPIMEVPDYPSSEHYTFKGWNREVPSEFPDEDMSFYPILAKNSSITFKSEPGLFPNGKHDLLYIGEISTDTPFSEFPPPDPIRTGYRFSNWNPSPPEIFPNNNIEIQSEWNPNQYGITFDYNGGLDDEMSSFSILPVEYDNVYPTGPSVTTKPQFTVSFVSATTGEDIAQTSTFNCLFNGYWSTPEADDIKYYDNDYLPLISSYIIDGDLMLYANWANPRAPTTGNFAYSPTKTGYTLSGWYTDRNWTTKVNYIPALSEDTTLYTRWGANRYVITFNYNGGKIGNATSSSSYVYYDGAYPDAPNITTKPQYTVSFVTADSGTTAASSSGFDRAFTGYTGNPNGTLYYNSSRVKQKSSYTIDGNLTVTAQWGNTGETGNFANASRTNYSFGGWFESRSSTTRIYNYSSLSGNKTLYAKWTGNPTTITVNYTKSESEGTGTGDNIWQYTLTIPSSAMTSVPSTLKLKSITGSSYISSVNSRHTNLSVYFDGDSGSKIHTMHVGNANEHYTDSFTLSGFPNDHYPTSSININIQFYLQGGNDHHNGSWAITAATLYFE